MKRNVDGSIEGTPEEFAKYDKLLTEPAHEVLVVETPKPRKERAIAPKAVVIPRMKNKRRQVHISYQRVFKTNGTNVILPKLTQGMKPKDIASELAPMFKRYYPTISEGKLKNHIESYALSIQCWNKEGNKPNGV